MTGRPPTEQFPESKDQMAVLRFTAHRERNYRPLVRRYLYRPPVPRLGAKFAWVSLH